jgi:hypothetical protein
MAAIVVLNVFRLRTICTMLKDERRETMHNIMRIGSGKKEKMVQILENLKLIHCFQNTMLKEATVITWMSKIHEAAADLFAKIRKNPSSLEQLKADFTWESFGIRKTSLGSDPLLTAEMLQDHKKYVIEDLLNIGFFFLYHLSKSFVIVSHC